jgi:Holliday junction resolvase RusA-like endonuclease
MEFFMEMRPPTATAQEHSVKMIHGRPVFFDPPKVKEAKQLLMGHLAKNKPDRPIEGAVELTAMRLFPKGRSHRHGEWRKTKPDTDNLQKLLKDCMTQVGFWKDDAQVVSEKVQKRWSSDPTGIWIEIRELEVDADVDQST